METTNALAITSKFSHTICVMIRVDVAQHIWELKGELKGVDKRQLFVALGKSESFVTTLICITGEMSTEINDAYMSIGNRGAYMWHWAMMS